MITFKHLPIYMILAAMVALVGCGSGSDDTTDGTTDDTTTDTGTNNDDGTTDDDGDSGLSCTTSDITVVIVPEITYTEVAETASSNDTEETAQLITTNTKVTGSMNGYGSPSDSDYIDRYVINVSEGDEFIITLEANDSNSGVNFNMYLNDGTSSNYNVLSEESAREEKITFTVPSGMSQLKFFVDDYDGGGSYILTVTTPAEAESITDVPTVECTSNFTGVISNAVDGSLLENVTVNLREGEDIKTGEIEETTTTNASGEFSFSAIESQTYTVEVQISNFITSYYNITLPGEKTINKQYSLSPTLEAGQYRIVLNWGATPSDLDSYMKGPKADGSGNFTVGWYNAEEEGTVLDKDDVSSYGPETITIETQNTGEYNYYVRCRATLGCSESEATVTIFDENGIFKQLEATTTETDRIWNVFTLSGTTYTEIDTYSSTTP